MTIGYSVENRPLEMYRFGTGDLAYLVVGGIHGGYEVNTVELMDELIEYFTAHPDEVPSESRLYILHSLNVDGLQKPYDADGRANAHQVDLNRNFPADWAKEWDRTGCWDYRETNGGTKPASEPETVAMIAFILEHPLVAMISYHAAAPGFYPSGNPNHADSAALSKYLSKVSGYPYPAVDMGCQMTGNLVDWAHTTGVAGADLELTDHYNTEFERNLKLVKALLLWRP
jgi:murein tripeptide amidase MpaA